MKDNINKARELALRIREKLIWIPCFLTRLALGYGFYATGKGKINNLDRVGKWFESLGIPFPEAHAWFIGHLEYFGGMLLFVGLLTRPVATLLASTMLVALATADRSEFLASWTSSSDKLPIEVTAFTYLLLLGWLIYFGSGLLSLDAIAGRFLWKQDSEEENE